VGQLDQFAKETFAVETATITRGAVAWQLPPEIGTTEVHLDGLMRVFRRGPLASLAAPWCTVGEGDTELALELKMQGDHVNLLSFDRATLRRLARQIQRREDRTERFDGEQPLWFVAAHPPAVIHERRTLTPIAPGCYRVGPEWLATTWIAANELPLADELVPFLVARRGRALDEFVRWVAPRRPLPWLLDVLELLPMSDLTYDYLRYATQEPESEQQRRRRKGIFEMILAGLPEERQKLVEEGELKGRRKGLRDVLDARGLVLGAGDEARIDGCTDGDTLDRWLRQAAVAASMAEALR